MRMVKISTIVIVWMFVTLSAFAELYELPEPAVTPSSRGYRGARRMEVRKLDAIGDPMEKAILLTEMADKRLAEAGVIVATRSKNKYIKKLMKDIEKHRTEADFYIRQGLDEGRDVTTAIEVVESSTKKHTEVLTDLLNKVPAKAQLAIQRAIEVSRTGRNVSLDRLEKIQRGEVPAGKPSTIPGKPRAVKTPEEIEKPSLPKEIERPGKIRRPEEKQKPEIEIGPRGRGRSGGGPAGRPGGRGR